MALLENGDATTARSSVLHIVAQTLPGDVVEVFRENSYLGKARQVGDTANYVFPIRMDAYPQTYNYFARICRGEARTEMAAIQIVYVEAQPILRDLFAGTAGVFIHDHAPDIGSTWIRKYDLDNAYAYDDNNFALTGIGGLVQADFAGSLSDRWVWNEVVPPSANYRTKLTFNLDAVTGYLEIALFARGDGEDAIRGYIQWSTNTEVQPQLSAISEGNNGYGTVIERDNGSGEHTLELIVNGDQATLLLDDFELQTRTLPTPLTGPGTIGFAFRGVGDLTEIIATRIETFAL